MNTFAEHPEQSTEIPILETPYGFPANALHLNAHDNLVHQAVMDTVLADARVVQVTDAFDHFEDTGTRNHSLGVGWVAVAGALELGLDARDAGMIGRAAIGHDLGKADERTQLAIKSTKTFEEDPELLVTIMGHPIRSMYMLSDLGFGLNESIIAGAHHGFQTERKAYGIKGDHVRAFREADGYVPPTRVMAEIVAAADHINALSVPPSLTGRNYLKGGVSAERAVSGVQSLDISPSVKKAITKVVGLNK